MTAIVGITWKGGALLAGDGIGLWGDTLIRESRPKVAAGNGFLVAAAGGCLFCNVALFLDVARKSREPLFEWAIGTYSRALRSALDGDDSSGTVLLATAGELVLVDSAGGATPVARDYFAIGSGGDVALGALSVLPRSLPPLQRARKALSAATRHVVGVGRPWSYISTDGDHGGLR